MHGNAPSRVFLGNRVANGNRIGDLASGVEDHRPIEIGDLAGAQASLDREQDHDAVSQREGGFGCETQHAFQHTRRDALGLFARH
jgi:hypothetical protein